LEKIKNNSPKGFLYSVTSAGIRYINRLDLALIYSISPANIAGVFTKNKIKAAPVILDYKKLIKGQAQAIILNSGIANACTGQEGLKDAERVCKELAMRLKISEDEVYVASTGVIGVRLPMEKMLKGIKQLVDNLGKAAPEDVAKAIMTTDTFPKTYTKIFNLGEKEVRLLGIAKGAGMISPDMATMLCILLTDIAIEVHTLKKILKEIVDETFNLITIDGDMSTNDTVLFMANAEAKNKVITENSKEICFFKKAVYEVMDNLSRMIAYDGEGSTKLIIIKVNEAATEEDAKKVGFSVAKSLLVKTAIYGNDPNWGRIMAAIGYSGVSIKQEKINIIINGIQVVKSGIGVETEEKVSESLKKEKIVHLDINLGLGNVSKRIYTSDLTEEYIKINACYRT